MTFGEFMRWRREQLNLSPEAFPQLSGSYINVIETGAQRPRKEETCQIIYDALHIQKLNRSFEWFWVYSLLNKNPDMIFSQYGTVHNPNAMAILQKLEDLPETVSQTVLNFLNMSKTGAQQFLQAFGIQEPLTPYTTTKESEEIKIGSTETDVLLILGPPEKKLSSPQKSKWIYNKEVGARLTMTHGKVSDIEFV